MSAATATDGPEGETPTQRAARLRREKRNAKMAAEGEDRLSRIKQLNGGIAPPDEVLGGPAALNTHADDPEEVDISNGSFAGRTAGGQAGGQGAGGAADNPMLQAMAQMQARQSTQQQPGQAQGGQAEDPLNKMLQQVMGMAGGGDPNDPDNAHNMEDPMKLVSALMGAANSAQKSPQQTRQPSSGSAYLWRLTHAIFAVVIASYIALTSTFNGSKLERAQSVYTEEAGYGVGARLFWIFVTAELGLQSTRFFLEGGQLQGGGMLATVANIAPEPWAGYVRAVGRWGGICGSVMSDAMVIVFVLGVMAWWRGLAG